MTAPQIRDEDLTMMEICDQTRTTEEIIQFLAKRGLLANSNTCDTCQTPRLIYKNTDCKNDGICWKCSTCKSKRSIRHGSFFSKSNLDLRKLTLFSYTWSQDCLQRFCARESGRMDKRTSIDWANFHR